MGHNINTPDGGILKGMGYSEREVAGKLVDRNWLLIRSKALLKALEGVVVMPDAVRDAMSDLRLSVKVAEEPLPNFWEDRDGQ